MGHPQSRGRTIPIKKGVCQGDAISPLLFNACLAEVFKLVDWEEIVIEVNREYSGNSKFADDIVITVTDCKKMMELNRVEDEYAEDKDSARWSGERARICDIQPDP